MTSENKKSYHHNHHDSNNTSSSSGRATDRMVSLVTLNSSDESSRSNSSLASSSHSNIDLVIDPSMGVSGSLATTSTPSPKMATTPKSSSNRNEEEAYYDEEDEEDEEETTESWSIKTPAVSGGGHFRRRNSSTSIYGTPRRQTSFFGEGNASSAAAAAAATTTSTSHLAQSALLSSVYDELMASNSLGVLVDSPEQEQRNDESEYNCTECGSYCDRYTAARNSKFSSDINGNSGVICETCLHKHWQGEINELLKFKASLETSVRELRRYLSMFSQSISLSLNWHRLKIIY